MRQPEGGLDGVKLERGSFARLVYAFDLDRAGGVGRSESAAAAERYESLVSRAAAPWRAGARVAEVDGSAEIASPWEDRELLEEYVLPHLARHVNVDRSAEGAPLEFEVAHLWQFSRDALSDGPDGLVPVSWRLMVGEEVLDFQIRNVELVLFRTFVGFLIFEVSASSEAVADHLDLVHHIRFYDLAEEHLDGRRVSLYSRRSRNITPRIDRSWGLEVARKGPVGLAPLIRSLMENSFPDADWTSAQVPGRLSVFSGLFVRGEPGQDSNVEADLEYRWRRFFHSRSVTAPGVDGDLQSDLVPYGEGMTLSYSLDGGGFFAFDAPEGEFFRSTLPDHLRRPYFFGYLLASHQRLALSGFSERVSDVWRDGSIPPREMRDLEDRYLVYLASCSFIQVMQTANHHVNHRKWLEVLEVERFQGEVENELDRLYRRLTIDERIRRQEERDRDEERVRSTERVVAAAGLGFAVPAIGLAAYALAEPDGVSWWVAVGVTAALAIVGTLFGLLITNRRWFGGGAQTPDDGAEKDHGRDLHRPRRSETAVRVGPDEEGDDARRRDQ